MPLDRILKSKIAVEPFYLLNTLPAQPCQRYLVDLAAGSYHIHEHGQLHRQLENYLALTVIAFRYNAFHVGGESIGKIGRAILGTETANIKPNCLFDKLRFTAAIILPIQLLDLRQRVRMEP